MRGAEIGVDKGYTEAFTDSDGVHHGAKFGAVMTAYSDQVAKTGQARNRLHALEKAHRAAGRTAKADRIRSNNLGRVKLDSRRERHSSNCARLHIKLLTASSTRLPWLARKI